MSDIGHFVLPDISLGISPKKSFISAALGQSCVFFCANV